jgi:hypothetical protein
MATVSTTVVEAWDKRWTTAEGRADWLDPDPEVMALLPELMGRDARTALDLGRGILDLGGPNLGSPQGRTKALGDLRSGCRGLQPSYGTR